MAVDSLCCSNAILRQITFAYALKTTFFTHLIIMPTWCKGRGISRNTEYFIKYTWPSSFKEEKVYRKTFQKVRECMSQNIPWIAKSLRHKKFCPKQGFRALKLTFLFLTRALILLRGLSEEWYKIREEHIWRLC